MTAPAKIQLGQVWKKDSTPDSYLVTKIYTEALATIVLLRKAGAEDEPPLRVRVVRDGNAQALPGFTFAQESGEF
ncbi:MAG: hypothetical protein ACRD50_08375 [Candidatus Acidiferrales bacterium]